MTGTQKYGTIIERIRNERVSFMKRSSPLLRLVLSAMFLAVGIVLPFFTGQIPEIGKMLLPMHLPVMLCGFICGYPYGAVVGFVLPLLRSLMFSAPALFPSAVAMAFELSVYGFLCGLVFSLFRRPTLLHLYAALLSAMLGGRAVWGVVTFFLMLADGSAFPMSAFLAGAFLNAIPGIVLQLVLIPSLMLLLDRTHLVPWREGGVHPKNNNRKEEKV